MHRSSPNWQPLSWDSGFLGYGVARLTMNQLEQAALADEVATARAAGQRLLYLVTAPDDEVSNASAVDQGAELIDQKVTFNMPLRAPATATPASSAIGTTTTFTPELEQLAWQSGEYSRFRLDAHFESGVYERLYSQWLRNSLSGEIARAVLVYQPAAEPERGLLTLGSKNGRADIGLLAVDERARGLAVGLPGAAGRDPAYQSASLSFL